MTFIHLIGLKVITLDEINERIVNFEYSHHDARNKPKKVGPGFSKKHPPSISGNAHENWTLLRLLPLILGDIVPENDPFWAMLMLVKDMLEICMAPCVNEGLLIYLDEIIQEHKRLYVEVAKESLKPKHHFIEHYSELFRCFGPLVHVYTLRYEAKHKFFKRIAKMCMNWINILKTLAVRHQLHEALLFQSDKFCDEHDFETGLVSDVSVNLMSREVQDALKDVSENGFVTQTSRLIIHGMDYTRGLAIHVDHYGGMPLFGKIDLIVLSSHKAFFLVSHLDTFLNERLHLLELCELNPRRFSLIAPSAMLDYYPLALYKYNNNYAVSLKHFLVKRK